MNDQEGQAWGMSQDEYEHYLQSQIDQLTDENLDLKREIDTLQQVARKSFGDLQREYMALEVKYHDLLKKECDIDCVSRAPEWTGVCMIPDCGCNGEPHA